MTTTTLGEPRFASPFRRTVSDLARIPAHIVQSPDGPPAEELLFELAGPRDRLFFDPQQTRAGIVTCGGLCPGMNNVIRSLYLELHHGYGVREVLGFRGGYQGLDPTRGPEPLALSSDVVRDIQNTGGTVLGTSRGPVDVEMAVDNLIRRGVNILFTIGGDGTQRGGNALFQEAQRRGHPLAVVGIPKTIDNDVAFVSRTFGYLTAVEEAAKVLDCAHIEAHSVHNGIALVKLMGRHAGFIAAGAAIASQDVNFAFVPEAPLQLDGADGFLAALKQRIQRRAHAVIVVAEGAGQELLAGEAEERDASGNVKLHDIGLFLRERIERYFKAEGIPVTLRYFDPSYLIRSVPADAEDAILCDFFARNAVHAAMAGKTGLVIGLLHDNFIHVPIELLVSRKKRLDLNGPAWHAVLAATGQEALKSAGSD
ncbi:MAG TPA: ATP-dependent 6-phosphofructokinase [Candidatus Competibacteraceae bacterium]|nr:MAG: ATP-dependent 6-phosphofructokinase [Candidatus Competibacteraceae bacterium]HOB61857.1 ATP-dependent 6-phosphofructokinase [Candidatus Competibacteraceae bacterium]HQA25421.1 ATP-dependent 6-phosphofructokinase [Candidatus Competibacteraceae bacterium]HQD56091.1 ATP-dependent 6-phosphofructokinase [Candidatus Competibacteraceae bacterium]